MAKHIALTTNASQRQAQTLVTSQHALRQRMAAVQQAADADLLRRAQAAKLAFDRRAGRA